MCKAACGRRIAHERHPAVDNATGERVFQSGGRRSAVRCRPATSQVSRSCTDERQNVAYRVREMPGTADSGAMAGEKIMGKSSGEGVGRMEHGFRILKIFSFFQQAHGPLAE